MLLKRNTYSDTCFLFKSKIKFLIDFFSTSAESIFCNDVISSWLCFSLFSCVWLILTNFIYLLSISSFFEFEERISSFYTFNSAFNESLILDNSFIFFSFEDVDASRLDIKKSLLIIDSFNKIYCFSRSFLFSAWIPVDFVFDWIIFNFYSKKSSVFNNNCSLFFDKFIELFVKF